MPWFQLRFSKTILILWHRWAIASYIHRTCLYSLRDLSHIMSVNEFTGYAQCSRYLWFWGWRHLPLRLYSALPSYRVQFSPNNARKTRPFERYIVVFPEFLLWAEFYLRICCAVFSIMLCCNTINQESIVLRYCYHDLTPIHGCECYNMGIVYYFDEGHWFIRTTITCRKQTRHYV